MTTASAPAAPAAAATPALSAADAAVVDQLRNLSSGKYDRIVGNKKDRTIVDAFYSGRDYAPLWITDGKVNERGKAVIAYLGHVDQDGLDPADYPVPNFSALSDPGDLAEAELKLDMTIITYAHHASVGRVHWSRVSGDISYTTTAPEPADVLAAMVEAKDMATALDAYEPHTPGYLALKAKLAEIRAGKAEAGKTPIENGAAPKIGGQDERVPLLRERLKVSGDGDTYDKALADAVKKYQQDHQLKVTGTLTQQTIEALNGRQPDKPIDIILANMERWRWMPHDLGNTYVIVNLADFTLAGDARRQALLDHPDRRRQAGNADADHAGGDEIHHHQSDLERAAVDRQSRIPAGAAAGSDGARPHGTEGRQEPRRHRAHLAAAGREQRARPHPLQLPEQIPGLSARHAGQVSVRLRQARL